MIGLALSGARSYLDLCVAVKNEERRLAELRRKQQYLKAEIQPSHSGKNCQKLNQALRNNPRHWKPGDATFVASPDILLKVQPERSESSGRGSLSSKPNARQI